MNLFEEKSLVKVCAPMVRYSRLPFRLLVRDYDTDLAFTPMLMSESFVKSEQYRRIEYSTAKEDTPLIVQFAAKNAVEFAEATEVAYNAKNAFAEIRFIGWFRNCVGVDLNCGCPQSWATKEGIGACMLHKPELVADILKQTRNRISDPNFSVSVKIRIFLDLQRTVDMVRQLEAAGISFLTVHGRTKSERNEPPHFDYIKAIVDSVDIPVIANGGVDSLAKAYEVQELTGAKGVMSASAMLENPALFAGHSKTPVECMAKWISINNRLDTHFTMFHRHLIHMCAPLLNRAEKRVFNNLTTREEVLQYVEDKFNVQYVI